MKVVSTVEKEIGVGIKGMGYYIPQKVITNHDIANMVETTDEWIQQKIGIKERHVCSEQEAASDLAIKAGERALTNAGIGPEELDLIIMTSLQPDHLDPLPCSLVQHKLGAVNAAAFNMSIGGCPDSIFSFVTACNYVLSGAYRTVMVVNAEVNSKFINWKDRSMCVFFGDGAGAWILQPVKKGKGLMGFTINNDGSKHDVIQAPAGGSRIPISKEVLEQGLHYPYMDSKKVFEFAVTVFPESVEGVLNKLNIKKENVKLFLSHQANFNIITTSLQKLGINMDRTFTNIDKYGNMSSASVPVVLAQALEHDLIKKDDIITLTAFGAGLAWGTCAIKWAGKEDFIA